MKTRLVKTDILTVRVPLPHPVFLGETLISEREFAVAVLETEDGRRGWGATFTRNTPVEAFARQSFLPALAGQNALQTALLWHTMVDSLGLAGLDGLSARALSIIDIALWDLKAQHAGLPLHHLLGGHLSKVPIMVPAGYRRDGETTESLLHEVEFYREANVPVVKFMFPPALVRKNNTLIQEARRRLGPGVVLGNDFLGRGQDVPEILTCLATVEDAGLDFLEDPFPLTKPQSFRELGHKWAGRVLTGETVSSLDQARTLINGCPLHAVRWDATVCGGVTAWLRLQALAAAFHLPVYAHCAPEIHAHLAAATGQPYVETSLPEFETINFRALLKQDYPIVNGFYELPETQGIGLELDEEKLAAFRV